MELPFDIPKLQIPAEFQLTQIPDLTLGGQFNTQYATIVFTALAFIVFAFVFWRDSTEEGFSSDKILDSFFMILLGGILGGKLLFRELDIDYFRYEFLTAPMILEGVLVGGALTAYWQIKKNRWEGWKVGDMLAPALAIFQSVLFFGFWLSEQRNSSLLVFAAFVALYAFIRSMKKTQRRTRGLTYFQVKRLNKLRFTGGLFALYLTGSSLIAILFLLAHLNPSSGFWWFQLGFYLIIAISAYVLIRRKLSSQGEGYEFSIFKRFSGKNEEASVR